MKNTYYGLYYYKESNLVKHDLCDYIIEMFYWLIFNKMNKLEYDKLVIRKLKFDSHDKLIKSKILYPFKY